MTNTNDFSWDGIQKMLAAKNESQSENQSNLSQSSNENNDQILNKTSFDYNKFLKSGNYGFNSAVGEVINGPEYRDYFHPNIGILKVECFDLIDPKTNTVVGIQGYQKSIRINLESAAATENEWVRQFKTIDGKIQYGYWAEAAYNLG